MDGLNPLEQRLAALGYKPLPEFAILDEHAHQRADGRGLEVFDRPRLERLAAKLNGKATYQQTGLPVIVGHTTPGVPEDKLPGIRGWCTRYQVGEFHDEYGNKKAAIFARPWAAPNEEDTFRKFPHRSIELWTGGEHGDDIHPLALLGPTAPRRNLGLHLFSRDATPGRYHYSRGVDMDQNYSFLGGSAAQAPPPASGSTSGMRLGDMTAEQAAAALAPALATTKEFSGLFQMRDEVAQMLDNESQEWEPGGFDQQPGMMGGMDPSMMGGMDPSMMAGAGMGGGYGGGGGGGYGEDQYPQQFSRTGGYYPQVPYYPQAQQFARQMGRQITQAQARAAAGLPPQPTRFSREHLHQYAPSTIPAQYQPPPGTKLESVPLPELPANDPYKAHFDRLTALLAPLVEKVQTQEKAATLGSVIDRDLTTLATQERVKFDFQKEREHLLKLPDDDSRKEHFERMRTNYARLGVADMPSLPGSFPVPGTVQPGTPNPTPQHGHQLTVGAMLPGQPGAPLYFQRGGNGTGLGGERAYDEPQLPAGLDAFTLAAQATAAKQPVATYLQTLRAPAPGTNGTVEKVR